MMSKETGGPAFPVVNFSSFEAIYPEDNQAVLQLSGMTLRDHFAGLAMQGDWAVQSEEMGEFANDVSEENLYVRAKVYYRMAEAMLLARGE